jgi:DNA-binding PadR family transcriptional regulator
MFRTELEYCVLGVIWRQGPCSTHAVRNEFARSPSAHWSASAGSIYPVVRRLAAARLIHSSDQPDRRRVVRDLSITPLGLADLRKWILRIDREATSATYDSVRTRLLFLRALASEDDRRRAFDVAVTETKARLLELSRETDTDLMEQLATIGASYELKARLKWLREIEPRVLKD